MGSPVNTIFLKYIKLEKTSSTAVYLQLTQQIINCIQRGILSTGEKLPGTRIIAKDLNLNRNTVIKSLDELHAQAWLEIIPNKGTFVLKQFYNAVADRPYSNTNVLNQYPQETGYSFPRSIILDNPLPAVNTTYYITDGSIDLRLNQFKQLASYYSSTTKRKTTLKKLINNTERGSQYFKEQLSNYLNQTRGLHIGKDNLLINRSSEMSIYILSRILLKENDIVIIAEWSNSSINMCFLQAGAKLLTIPVDDFGIQVDELDKIASKNKIRLIYITPHHHYPTTVTLSATRRVKLLQLAKKHGFIIIEDDYDYDFHYEKSAILPLCSADSEGMVIYTGTFAKSLGTSFQTSFIVAPKNLIQELYKYKGILDKQGDQIMEQTLGEMIEEGNIHRFLKKSNQTYRERRDYLCQQLDLHFPNQIRHKKPKAGLAIWIEFNINISLSKLSLEALKHNLNIPRNLLYQNKNIIAMRLGFGHMNLEEIQETIQILKKSILKITSLEY